MLCFAGLTLCSTASNSSSNRSMQIVHRFESFRATREANDFWRTLHQQHSRLDHVDAASVFGPGGNDDVREIKNRNRSGPKTDSESRNSANSF